MALEQLLASLTRDADQAIADLLHAAREDADAVLAAAAESRRRRLEDAAAARRRELEARLEEDIVEAGREASRAVLRIRADILERVFDRCRAGLAARLGDPLAHRAATTLAVEAASYLGGQAGTMRCHPALRQTLDAVARDHGLTLTDDVALGPGAHLTSADGRVSVDATFDELLRRRWPDEAIRLAAHLEAVR